MNPIDNDKNENTTSPLNKSGDQPQTPDALPTPEQIQKEFQEMVQKKFGGTVQVVSMDTVMNQSQVQEPQEEPKKYNFSFKFTPKQIVEHLNKSITSQEDAKKALALAVCDHYRHIEAEQKGDVMGHYQKQNVLLLGPTGVGKTFLVRSIAELIGVPFVKADATRFSEVGYMGANVDDIIRDLIQQAKGDLKLAENGIVYVDEIDKIASSPNRMGRDVSGRGVQFGFLRLLEDAEVDINSSHDMASQFRTLMNFQKKGAAVKEVVRTKNILFIFSGAFADLTAIIKKRMSGTDIGIHSGLKGKSEEETAQYLNHVEPQDLVNFGFEQEFIGRLPVITSCKSLRDEDMFHILKHSQASIIHQYVRNFQHYGIDLSFTDDALWAIAKKAQKQKTGARALVSVCESTLRDFKYEIPGTQIRKLEVTPELIQNPQGFLRHLLHY